MTNNNMFKNEYRYFAANTTFSPFATAPIYTIDREWKQEEKFNKHNTFLLWKRKS